MNATETTLLHLYLISMFVLCGECRCTLTHEGPSIEILHTKIIFHKIPSILGIHMNLKKKFFVRPTS